jgi:hypothetical protein
VDQFTGHLVWKIHHGHCADVSLALLRTAWLRGHASPLSA